MNSKLTYIVDSQDVIIYADLNFKSFAEENGAEDLYDNIIGRSIWDFMYSDQINNLYGKLFNGVREAKKGVQLKFRCDNREVLRFMEMEISPKKDNHLEIKTSLLRELPRKIMLSREILYNGIKDGQPMCSHCNKIYCKEYSKWIEIDQAMEDQIISDQLSVTFKICNSCVSTFKEKMEGLEFAQLFKN